MRLNAKLILIMMSLLIIAILTLFLLNQSAQNSLVREIQDSSQVISKAVQMSIEDLTSSAEESRLNDYLAKVKEKGIQEINVINTEGEIVDSSDPDKIGKTREIKKLEKGLHPLPKKTGASATVFSQKQYEVVVPVIVGDEQLGYVQIKMLLDNIKDLQHANFIRRLFATCMVFAVGIALAVFLAKRYTEPINNLVNYFKKVSAGDLSVTIPVKSRDEIGELSAGFNNMVEKLREREALEKRLYEAEHLSRVGQLASGIAHEIRNPLNYISLAIDHIKNVLTTDCANREEIENISDKIKEEVRRANYMVVNFMNYGRPLKLRRTEAIFETVLDNSITVIEEKLKESGCSIIKDIEPNFPPLWVDQEMFRNCILNFITNAIQAMPDGGVIKISAKLDENRKDSIIKFADSGKGITAEDINKIFQPYFTTKDVGIGLGLAITERIIKEHGGNIDVVSEVGKGTIFTVWLPKKVEEANDNA